MAKRMKETKRGRYAKQSTKLSISRRITAIIIIAVLIMVLILEASLSFFSDVVVNAANAVLGTVRISTTNVLIEEQDVVRET